VARRVTFVDTAGMAESIYDGYNMLMDVKRMLAMTCGENEKYRRGNPL